MIDPVQIPMLLKALDFVFDEGRKILQERRDRRAKNESAPPVGDVPALEAKEIVPLEVEEAITVKEGLSTSKVDESLWKSHEAEVQHLVRLLETYSRNYHLAKEQYAKWGSALVPPIIMHNLTEAENSMTETVKQLEGVLSKVYAKDVRSTKQNAG